MSENHEQKNNGAVGSNGASFDRHAGGHNGAGPGVSGNFGPIVPEKSGENRNPDGTFKEGASGNPLGRPKGNISITEAIKRRLGEIYNDPAMPLAEKKTHLDAIVEAIMYNALKNRDQKALKDIWNYIDGLPKGSFDVGVDREGLAELTEFMKSLANPKEK